MLESAGVPHNWIKKLQGRVVGGSMGPYSLPEETGELFQAYVRAYHKLRIFGEQASTQKLEEQANELEALRRKNIELEEELAKRVDEELEYRRKLEERLDRLEKRLMS